MESDEKKKVVGLSLSVIIISFIFWFPKWVLKKFNIYLYEHNLPEQLRKRLPPGDLGWPLIGNLLDFLHAFKSTYPDSFTDSYISRYGKTGMYKCFMYGFPSVLVTTPEANKKVLNDDQAFKPGWPVACQRLMGRRAFNSITPEDHKRLRYLTAAPINGKEALSLYMPYIEENVISSLEEWSKMGEIEFLTEVRRFTFKVIAHIFLGAKGSGDLMNFEKDCNKVNEALKTMAINIPGFAYYKALKARKRVVKMLQVLVDERREVRRNGVKLKKDMTELLLDAEDENGKGLTDEDIIDILLMYLNAGNEASGHVTMWAALFLQAHPDIHQKAKEEQERIARERPPSQGLTLNEIMKMEYLSMVIDETLRVVSVAPFVCREALKDVKLGAYMIPKGWKVLAWFRTVHFDPDVYINPQEFNPERWMKCGSFLPFGAGSRLCPGKDLAKLEIAIFLHHFLLGYKLERQNPKCRTMYLPYPKPIDNCLGRIRKVSG